MLFCLGLVGASWLLDARTSSSRCYLPTYCGLRLCFFLFLYALVWLLLFLPLSVWRFLPLFLLPCLSSCAPPVNCLFLSLYSSYLLLCLLSCSSSSVRFLGPTGCSSTFCPQNVSCTRFVTTTTAAIRPVRNLCLVLLLFPITTTTTTTTMPRQVHWYTGTLVHRYTNTLVHKYTGAQVHWYTGTSVFKYIGISVQNYTGIPVNWYYGTPVHRCMHWCTGTSL